MSTTSALPWVRVPVLSNAAERTRASTSNTPPSLMMTLSFAAELIPPINATGVAMSSGHGVATTSTSANRTGSPLRNHAKSAISNDTMVNGTA